MPPVSLQAACAEASYRVRQTVPPVCVRRQRAWKLAYWRMQNGCAVFRVMACSQKTCSGHCTTAALRMRFSAYCRPVASSAASAPLCQRNTWVRQTRVGWRCEESIPATFMQMPRSMEVARLTAAVRCPVDSSHRWAAMQEGLRVGSLETGTLAAPVTMETLEKAPPPSTAPSTSTRGATSFPAREPLCPATHSKLRGLCMIRTTCQIGQCIGC